MGVAPVKLLPNLVETENRRIAANLSGQDCQNKNRVAILAELDKEKRKLLMQNQSSTHCPGASIAFLRPWLKKNFRDQAEQWPMVAQQKATLRHAQPHQSGHFILPDSAFGNLILPVLPCQDEENDS
ncbi:SOSS complex subunit C-like [Sorex araneus]|uniref:SOSS complex subunit C-like n=1 Tax=Sorex araneus TaxID=42254 RepID=UPI002433F0B3|nr:SOSS complex subunit C-like [Sorex araneus]